MAKATMEKRVTLQHLNPHGRLHGGNLMKWMDEVGADAARGHSDRFCVTAHVDNFSFLRPVMAGERVFIEAVVTRSWSTSIEVGLRAQVLNVAAGSSDLVASAYYVYVALDENQRPTQVVEFVPQTDDEKRRWEDAGRRRELRMREKARRDQSCL
jgi:acyl-CoA hydrolase